MLYSFGNALILQPTNGLLAMHGRPRLQFKPQNTKQELMQLVVVPSSAALGDNLEVSWN